ncbi:MAG: hypothetical protein IPH13_14070 [Planctomycetes bacterium]|nr:hypothetical protein [Planctomycetota bacterium]MCC7169925.1 hypothetical protein [Planctomycetota bacterium]
MMRRSFVLIACCALLALRPSAHAQDDPASALEALAALDRATRERAQADVRARLFDPMRLRTLVSHVGDHGPEAILRLRDAVVATPACLPIVLHVARSADGAHREVAVDLLRALLLAEWARREPPPSKKPGNDPAFEEGTQVGLEWPIGSPVSWPIALTWLEQTAPGRRGLALHPRVKSAGTRMLDAHQLARSTASGLLARWLEGSELEVVDAGLVLLLAPRGRDDADADGDERGVLRCLDALLADGVDDAAIAAVVGAVRIRGAANVAARAFVAHPDVPLLRAIGADAQAEASSPTLVRAVLVDGGDEELVRLATRLARDSEFARRLAADGFVPELDADAARRFASLCAFAAAAARDVETVPSWTAIARTSPDPAARIEALRTLIEIDPRAADRPELATAAFAGGVPEVALRQALEAVWTLQCANDHAGDAVLRPWSFESSTRAVRALAWPFRGGALPAGDARELAIAWAAMARRGEATPTSFGPCPRWADVLAAPAVHPLVAEGLCAAVPGLGRSSRFHVDAVPSTLRPLWIETLRLATLEEVEDEDQTYASRLALELAPLRTSDPTARRVAAELRSVIYESPRGARRVLWNAATVFSPR